MNSSLQKFTVKTVLRNQLQAAPYNPRQIDDEARKRLRDNLKRMGLMRPIVANERTMRVISGHQRLAIVDSLERRIDYELDVAFVDLDDKTEREQCIFFNNQQAMGMFDFGRLEKMVLDKEIEIEKCGFSSADLAFMFPAFERPTTPAEQAQLQAVESVSDEIKAAEVAARPQRVKLTKEQAQAKRKEIRQRMAIAQPESSDVEFFTVLTFESVAAKQAFLDDLKIDHKEKIVSGVLVSDIIQQGIRHGESERKEAS